MVLVPVAPPAVAARAAAMVSAAVALVLAALTRGAHSVTGQVLFGSFLVLVLISAWLLWFRDDFMVRAISVAVMACVGLGSVLAGTVGMPGRGHTGFGRFDFALAVMSLSVCAVLVVDGWFRGRGAE